MVTSYSNNRKANIVTKEDLVFFLTKVSRMYDCFCSQIYCNIGKNEFSFEYKMVIVLEENTENLFWNILDVLECCG